MDRSTRLIELVQLLAGRRRWTVAEVADRFGVSERTVFRDFSDLSRRNIPITRDEHGYRLLDHAIIRPLALTGGERAALKLVLGNPSVRAIAEIDRTLEMVESKLDAATRSSEETPIALTLAGPDCSGEIPSGLTDVLDGAVRARTPVSIHYRSLAGRRTSWRGVDPYVLVHRETAWYLIGRCHVHDEPRVFRLDRITAAKPLDGGFEPPDFDLDEHLRHTWSIYVGREVHEVVIRFDAALAPLLEAGAHHPGERIGKLGNGDLEYRVSLSHLSEIARWVLGFGGQARAVEPPELVRLVAETALQAYQRHHDAAGQPDSATGRQDALPGLPPATPGRQRPLI